MGQQTGVPAGREGGGSWRDLGWSPLHQAPCQVLWATLVWGSLCREHDGGAMSLKSDPQAFCGSQIAEPVPWIPAPASKGGGRGQGMAWEAPQKPPGAGGCGKGRGEASEVRPIGKYLEPLARGRPPWGGPAPTSRPRRDGHRKTNTRRGLSAEERPALPAPRPQLVRPGLDLTSLCEGLQLGENVVVSSWRMSRGCRLGWDHFIVLLIINVPATIWVPGSHMGPWKQRMVCCSDF